MGNRIQYYLPLLLIFWIAMPSGILQGQGIADKVWFNGLGRAFFAQDRLKGDILKEDSTTSRSSNGGHMLLDLNIHVNPNPKLEISSIVRFRTELGGFWGAGTTVQLRQLYLRGILGKGIHYSIGDLYLTQSRFTLFNGDQEGTSHANEIFNPYRDIIDYENFYLNNNWRLQGMQTNFTLQFNRFIRSIDVDAFIARNRGAVWLGAPDELFGGASILLKQSKSFDLGFNTVSLFEVPSTSNGATAFHNPVGTITSSYKMEKDSVELKFFAEAGMSMLRRTGDSLAPADKTGNFLEAGIALAVPKKALKFKLAYRAVNSGFRSTGAQTKRFDFNGSNTVFPRLGNAQTLRPTTAFDLMSDDLRYNQSLSQTLMNFDPKYNNSTPYGDATPNRAGIHFEANFEPANGKLVAYANLSMSQELQGQGTLELKRFLLGQLGADLNVYRLIDWKRKLILSAGLRMEQTTRGGDSLSQVNLAGMLADIGLRAELFENFECVVGAKMFQAKGNEYLSQRNIYGELIDYPVYIVDQSQNIYALGIRYNFQEDIYLQLAGNWISVNDRVGSLPKYQIHRLLLVFNMNL